MCIRDRHIVEYLESHPEFRIYFGPGPRISKIDPKLMSRIYALHPVMHLNENEALSFTKEDGIDAAANAVFSRTQNDVIITLGAKGAYYCTASSSGYVPGIAATQIDTIGAGDSHICLLYPSRSNTSCHWTPRRAAYPF